MPPQMPDYRIKARRRMKLGLHPSVVAAANDTVGQTGELRTNTTGNARSGQQYREVVENGHRVHVYADGTRIGLADKPNPHVEGQGGFRRPPHHGISPGDFAAGQGGFRRPPVGAPNTGQPGQPMRPPEGTGQRIAPPGQLGRGPVRFKEGHITPEGEAALQALAKQRQMALHAQSVGKLAKDARPPAPGQLQHALAQLKQRNLGVMRRKRRRLTGGMLAP